MNKITRALISLTDKSGIEHFAAALDELGVEILSTGGTAERLRQAGIRVVDVSEFTGFTFNYDPTNAKKLHKQSNGIVIVEAEDYDDVDREGAGRVRRVGLHVEGLDGGRVAGHHQRLVVLSGEHGLVVGAEVGAELDVGAELAQLGDGVAVIQPRVGAAGRRLELRGVALEPLEVFHEVLEHRPVSRSRLRAKRPRRRCFAG